MKLSDVKGERTFDVIAEIIDPIMNISADKSAAELFRREKVPEGMETRQYLVSRVKKSLPPLLKNHKQDVICLISAIAGVTPKEYVDGLNLLTLTRDCIELLTDDAFLQFFTSAQNGDSSGSAPENITDPQA